jgi:hypothetical protein
MLTVTSGVKRSMNPAQRDAVRLGRRGAPAKAEPALVMELSYEGRSSIGHEAR